MADTLADALALFTKVNTNLLKRVEKLEKSDSAIKKPTETVKEPDPVVIEEFSKRALTDLSKIIGPKAVERKEEKKPAKGRNLLEDILGVLGLAGASLLALKDKIQKWLSEKIGTFFDDIVTGLKNQFNKAKTLLDDAWKSVKGIFDDIGKGISKGIDSVKGVLDDAIKAVKESRLVKFLDNFYTATKEAIKSLVSKLSTLFDDVVNWGLKQIDSLKGLAKTAGEKLVTAGKNLLPGAAGVATAVVNTAKQGVKRVGEAISSKGKAIGGAVMEAGGAVAEKAGKVYEGAKKVGAKVLDKAAVMKNIVSKLGAVKITSSVLSKVLKRVPIIGPLFEGFFASKDIEELIQKHMEDPSKYTLQMLHKDIGTRVAEGLGGMLGGSAGATVGGVLGSVVPVGGNILGAVAGGILGDMGGRWLGRLMGSKMEGGEENIGRYLFDKFYLKKKTEEDEESEGEISATQIQDGIITKTGELIQTHKEDTLYAMKNGGPFEKYFNKNNELLEKQGKNNTDAMNKQIKALTDNNRLLMQILEKIQQPSISTAANVVNNNFSSPVSIRGLQGA